MFRQYGRSKSWFSDRSSVVANLPNGVTWEDYYYTDSYKYNLSYETTGATSSGTTGTISITLRAHVTTHALKPKLVVAAPNLFTKLTAADITAAFTGWKAALQTHWTNRNYKVHLGAPDCPGVFTIKFSLVAESDPRKAHVSLGVLNMKHPKDDPHWAKILKNPGSGKFGTAKELVIEWRSNARKINIGDSRSTLILAHEYGHWIGWGDEYIEVTMPPIPHPNNSKIKVLTEIKNNKPLPLRVAVRIINPTKNHHNKTGSPQEDIDITTKESSHWLMGDMINKQTYPERYVYTIVDDFIRMYNKDHYNGKPYAYCIKVVT